MNIERLYREESGRILATLVRRELRAEAIRLGRLLRVLLPAYAELSALLALMLLHDSRRNARIGPDGEIRLLEEQDRGLWDQAQIHEGSALAECVSALRSRGLSGQAVPADAARLGQSRPVVSA